MSAENPDYDFRKILEELRDDYWRSLEAVDEEHLNEQREFVVVRLGERRFALPAGDCREVLRPPRVVKVPRAGAHIRGIINLRGEIVAVTDLRPLLGSGLGELPERPQLVVAAGSGITTALLVDRVEGLVTIDVGQIEAVAAGLTGLQHDLIAGQLPTAEGLITFIDLQRTLARPELVIDQKAGERL